MNLRENRPFPHMMYRVAYLPKKADRAEEIAVRDDRVPSAVDFLKNDLRCEILSIDCLGYEKEKSE